LYRRVCCCVLCNTRGSFIIPQKRVFAYNNFVRNYLPCGYNEIAAPPEKIWRLAMTLSDKENSMRRMFGFMIGIVVGALIGSAVALLLAPETGDKFRSEIRARGEVLVNDVRHAATARRIELTEQLESMRAPRADS
jgi:YtxH-like protein